MSISATRFQFSRTTEIVILTGVIVVIGSFLFVMSQGSYFNGDEGFYLLAAQLIRAGKRPYIDFFYQHTPMDIYFTAGWMALFGNSWRSVHAFSAVLLAGSTALLGWAVYTRWPQNSWRLLAAIGVALLFAVNLLVAKSAVLAQPYALSVFLVLAAFLVSLRAREHPGIIALWLGLISGVAVASSFLNAAVGPLLLLWLGWHTPHVARLKQCAYFILGSFIGALPVVWFALRAWREVLFDLVTFHAKYRHLSNFWRGKNVMREDLKIFVSWLDSGQGMLLAIFGAIGAALFWFSRREGRTPIAVEVKLATLVVIFLGGYLCLVPASCPQYFISLIPYLSLLAVAGLYGVTKRVCPAVPPVIAAAALLGVYALDAARSLHAQLIYPDYTWTEEEQIGALINRVLPINAPIYCDDAAVYAVANRIPPLGLENNYSFVMPAEAANAVHVLAYPQIYRMVAEGKFSAVVTWGAGQAEDLQLARLYTLERKFPHHQMFWQWSGPTSKEPTTRPAQQNSESLMAEAQASPVLQKTVLKLAGPSLDRASERFLLTQKECGYWADGRLGIVTDSSQ